MKLENNPPLKLKFDEYNQYEENDKLDDNIINSNKGILIFVSLMDEINDHDINEHILMIR